MSHSSFDLRSGLALLMVAALTACLSTTGPKPPFVLPPNDAAVAGPDAAMPGPDAATPGPDASVPLPPGEVRIATFNTHLFFDTVCQSGACGPGDFEQQPSQGQFDARADRLAAGIRSLGAGVVLLQELETQASLDALSARLSDVLPSAVLGEKGFAGSVDVAVMSSAPILEVRLHGNQVLTRPDGSTTTFSREFPEVHLQVGPSRVIVFPAHFRSKNTDDPGRRLAEAQAAAQILTASAHEFPTALIVLGGDLNDVPGSAPITALDATGELLRVASELPADQQVTYFGFGGNALDHLFVDTLAGGHYLPGTCHRVGDAPSAGLAGSDHAALVADFALP